MCMYLCSYWCINNNENEQRNHADGFDVRILLYTERTRTRQAPFIHTDSATNQYYNGLDTRSAVAAGTTAIAATLGHRVLISRYTS